MKLSACLYFSMAILPLLPFETQAYTINDNYWGGSPTGGLSDRDVVHHSDRDTYDISGMNVTFSGTTLKVDIFSTFFSPSSLYTKKIDGHYINGILADKTLAGDLFISTKGWDPYGSSKYNYRNDTIDTDDTVWNYAVVMSGRWPNDRDGGKVYLYAINKNGTIYDSYDNDTDYRNRQMYRYAPNGATALAVGSWSIYDLTGTNYDKLSISFDADYLFDHSTSSYWGFHWTESCGNDVIAGKAKVTYPPVTPPPVTPPPVTPPPVTPPPVTPPPVTPPPVPEPSTFILTAFGIVGAAVMKRNRKVN